MDNKKTGSFIKLKLKELGITQDQLAEKLNVTSAAVSLVLNGKNMFDLTNLQTLSVILDVPIDMILNAGEEPATALELLAMTSKEKYLKEDPDLKQITIKDHKGNTLFDYILKHENISLIELFIDSIIREIGNNISLQTVLIKHNATDLLKKVYTQGRQINRLNFNNELSEFSRFETIENYRNNKEELNQDELDYIKALAETKNEEILELCKVFSGSNKVNHFSEFMYYAIMYDAQHILKIDHERRLNSPQQFPVQSNLIDSKMSKLLEKSIEFKSVKCNEYCYESLSEFRLEDYFKALVKTKDKNFIHEFIKKYKNKSPNNYYDNKQSNFNNLTALKELILGNDIELLDYATEFSTQEALDEALFSTKGSQIEMIRILVSKGARFMVYNEYSNQKYVLDSLTAFTRYLMEELEKK